MAIRTVVTRGYGNGTFNGTIPLVVLRGYAIGVVTVGDVLTAFARDFALQTSIRDLTLTADDRDFALQTAVRDLDLTADDRDFTLRAQIP